MSKVTLSFKLPEEAGEYKHAYNGSEYHSVLNELDQYFRNRIKYENLGDQVADTLQASREKLHELMDEYEVEL